MITARPDRFELDSLLELRGDPPRAGQWASEARQACFGARALLRTLPERPPPESDITVERADDRIDLAELPIANHWREGDRLLVAVEPGDESACRAYARWLLELHDLPQNCSLAPWSRHVGATTRLWAFAVARLVLPCHVRVEARHDLVGIRLAQIALAFGADTLSGPVAADRKLPVAGVTRPTEATPAGLRNLIEQAGLEPVFEDPKP